MSFLKKFKTFPQFPKIYDIIQNRKMNPFQERLRMSGVFLFCNHLGETMAQEFAKAFYNSKQWKKCRMAYIRHRQMVDGGLCETCHKELGYIVHHKVTLTTESIRDDSVTLSFDNLEYDCKACHDSFEGHGLNKSVKPLCVFDESGQPISIREIDRAPR